MSSPPLIGGDDDEGFDWEAAVREIDVACENAKPSSSSFHHSRPSSVLDLDAENRRPAGGGAWNSEGASNYSSSALVNNGRRTGNCRQMTLDSFVGKAGAGRQVKKWVVEDVEGSAGNMGEVREGGFSCVEIDAEAAKTWVYPVNVPLREYQLAITRTALFSNTLVALPTGLGKTLIAAVVMYNYFRWFPEGKIVFAAPSRPLVLQQIEACHNIVGIPQEWTIDMTGQINPTKRTDFWKTKRVFFVTPQVLEKDIQAGTCLVRNLVCLVIDEAHRAMGNYAYCVAVRELMAVPVELRILALSATPGSKQQTVQQIIDNLQISTLEYRDENDPDVIPYVHNRKIELIAVPMGKDALDINKLLLDVIRPYVSRLSAVGLLQNRDCQTLSPPDLLNSRDKFRRAPPQDLPQNKFGEIEACFGGLLTLYHIKRLLSSHGIRPAYEMLKEKLEQGSFARLMSRNEDIKKMKLLMERNLTHGAPSPKLSKMLEVLIDHFKSKESQNSRVIIFSNFRGSVRDIMNSLASISDLVKATEFIGQSSGKALKGQSQKVQQAVLQKFRAGGYNVIVATSIGEEGLDIMEVDLVVCFDANVSPLRMIQRMGRTGRKHDGRVDILLCGFIMFSLSLLDYDSLVLACEGSEMKGYTRKLANSRTITKHMHNGGTSSFSFHSSSRMIPHIFKPEVQFVEMSIEQYIPRGKKVKDATDIQTPIFTKKLTAAESAVVAKYFQPCPWRPSLIAFPSFQAFPSRVHQVMHSHRTGMLIDTMQNLQALSFPLDSRGFSFEDEAASGKCQGTESPNRDDNDEEDLGVGYGTPEHNSQSNSRDSEGPISQKLTTKNLSVLDLTGESHPTHAFLFGSDFVSVDSLGKVLISYVPSLPLKLVSYPRCPDNEAVPLNCAKRSPSHLKTLVEGSSGPTVLQKFCTHLNSLSEDPCKRNISVDGLKLSESAILVGDMVNGGDSVGDSFVDFGINSPCPSADECCHSREDTELSPRLTNMMQNGVVPESPTNDHDLLNDKERAEIITPMKLHTRLLPVSPGPWRNESNAAAVIGEADMADPSIIDQIQTPLRETSAAKVDKIVSSISPAPKASNSSKDWPFSPADDKSDSVKPVRRLKRLRKVGDLEKNKNPGSIKDAPSFHEANPNVCVNGAHRNQPKQGKGKREQFGIIQDFIEEEAEVSENGEVSEDERVDEDDNSYDQSFIDDRINPTAGSAETQPSRVDMMAVYRRSLLSQSPMVRESPSASFTPDCNSSCPSGKNNTTGSSSTNTLHSLRTPLHENQEGLQSPAVPCTAVSNIPTENSTMLEMRKRRKLTFHQPAASVPIINLEEEFSKQLEADPNPSNNIDDPDTHEDMLYDDQFFAALDALEAQATTTQQNRPNLSVQKQDTMLPNSELHGTPTFDLGI
ncbi:unnamed protein product [Linum tenue]|uniref:DEAD-box ATP-dependent RNA helicase FANCM n=1 Tax=Linum tenue TaxID=586396 RepID=A0AAV0RJW0_9ROSI|nr:unnamed protein product [Linum tenue]